jgi:tetratricopeptide (TPR) repeat protein
MSVLETVAAALEVPLSELAAEAPVVAAAHEEPPGAEGLRLVLSGAWSLRAMLNGHHSPDPATFRPDIDHARDLRQSGRYTELTALLQDLVPALETGARAVPGDQQPAMFELLAAAYQSCSAALSQMGEHEAAWIAADRSMSAAERAGNPLLVAASVFRLVFVFIGARHFGQAETAARTAADALASLAADGATEATSLWGALTLQRAEIAAHLGDAAAAYRFLDEAREAAGRVGPGRDDFGTEFGPANVTLHEIAVAVQLGDAGRALRAAETADPSTLRPERRARLLIDTARAHAQLRHPDDAVSALRQAEEISPELVRGDPVVRQLVADLLTMQNPPSAGLSALSGRITAP